MTSGTPYEQGDILLVPFPFTNLGGIKKRPVLVLSHDSYNKKSADIITCGITSNVKDAQCSVLIDNSSLSSGSLPTQSRIKADKLFTLDKTIIIKKIGKIDKETMKAVKEELLKVM
jgi:mRNA interferase MazF